MPVKYSIVKDQTSYGVGHDIQPAKDAENHRSVIFDAETATFGFFQVVMVGLGRLELPTSPLSGVRSNHLSYRP